MIRAFITAMALVSTALACAPQPPKYFITFGDSYSQTGFEIGGTKPNSRNPLGNPALPGWTASGGLDWVGFMVTEFNASLVYSYNLAYGGATTDAGLIPPYSPEVRSFVDQVKIFSNNLASKPSYAPWTAENTLVGVWMGVNDVGNSFWFDNSAQLNAEVVGVYFQQLEVLYRAGVRQFVLLTVPPTWTTPLMKKNEATLKPAIASYNRLVVNAAAKFTAGRSVTLKVVDTHPAFFEAVQHPTQYGAPNAVCENSDGTSCLWFNDYHPGVAIQRLVAAEVADVWGGGFFQSADSVLCS